MLTKGQKVSKADYLDLIHILFVFRRIQEQVLRSTDLYFQGGEWVRKVLKCAFKLRLKQT